MENQASISDLRGRVQTPTCFIEDTDTMDMTFASKITYKHPGDLFSTTYDGSKIGQFTDVITIEITGQPPVTQISQGGQLIDGTATNFQATDAVVTANVSYQARIIVSLNLGSLAITAKVKTGQYDVSKLDGISRPLVKIPWSWDGAGK